MSKATQDNGAREKVGAGATAGLNSLTQLENDVAGPFVNEAHDGRAHSGFSGDDGQHEPVDGTATAASLQPGHAGDLGAAYATASDDSPTHDEDDADTGRAVTGSRPDEPDGAGDVDDIELNYPSVRTKKNPGDPRSDASGVGLQRRFESDTEQPRGDGNYLKDGDRETAIDTNPDPDTGEP